MNKTVLIAVFLLGHMSTYAQEILTIENAMSIATENSPSLIQSRLSLEQSELNLKARNALLKSQFALDVTPFSISRQNQYDSYNSAWYDSKSMSSSASFAIRQPIKLTDGTVSLVNDVKWQNATNKTRNSENSSYSHEISLQISQPIFTYNRTKMELAELELALETTRLNYKMQKLNIEKNVTTQFYQVYQNQKSLDIAQDEFENQKQNYEIIKDKVENGLLAAEELYQAEVNLATSESSVYSSQITYENSKDNFKILLGMSLETDFSVLANTDIAPLDVNLQDAEKHGLSQRMELREKAITIERDVFSIIEAKASSEFKGEISGRVGISALGEKVNSMYDNPTNSELFSINLSIPIFDWGSKKAKVKSSELAKQSDEISLDEERKDIILNIRQVCRNLPVLLMQIEIKKKSMENAARTYDINMEKYRNGNISGMDLQQYQTQLTDAKQSYTNALIEYKIELLNLKIQTLWDFESNSSYLNHEI